MSPSEVGVSVAALVLGVSLIVVILAGQNVRTPWFEFPTPTGLPARGVLGAMGILLMYIGLAEPLNLPLSLFGTDPPEPRVVASQLGPTDTATVVPALPTATTPLAPVTSTPTACDRSLLTGGFGKLYQENVSVRVKLGCPTAPEAPGYAVQELFEQGTMYWWEATDTIYVFLGVQHGAYQVFPAAMVANLPTPVGHDPNERLPGFDRVYWANPTIQQKIGKPLTGEILLKEGTDLPPGVIQPFQQGLMIFTPDYGGAGKTIFVLYDADKTFERIKDTLVD